MFTFMGFHMPRDGYGYGTIKIAGELAKRHMPIVDMRSAAGGFGMVGDKSWSSELPVVALCTPDWLPFIKAPKLISYTMFEATKLPAGWVDILNERADGVVVPCQWCAEVFRDNGVTKPIHVAKWGVDAVDYPIVPASKRLQRGPFTFLWSGTADYRKGWDVAYRAFIEAFSGKDSSVRLILHLRDELPGAPRFADRNVDQIVGRFDPPELRAMLAMADVFLFPSRGEGWGSPPREAASTGLPVMATDWSGLAEDIEHWTIEAIPVAGMSPAQYGWWDSGTIGEWAEPDINALARSMREVVEAGRSYTQQLGLRAANWLHANATWSHTADALVRAVEQIVKVPAVPVYQEV